MARGSSSAPVVVVTGGNRGIGLEICRQLATRGAQVVLTARQRAAGEAAVKKLAAQKLAVAFHSLDVTDGNNIVALRDFLQDTYGHLDVLINNAGIIAKAEASGRAGDDPRARTAAPDADAAAVAQTRHLAAHRKHVERHGCACGQ